MASLFQLNRRADRVRQLRRRGAPLARPARFGLEPLESRTLLAVDVDLIGDVLVITGNDLLDDQILLMRDPGNTSRLDVGINGDFFGPYDLDDVNQINVFGRGGDDTLTVNSGHGLINVIRRIRYDGGDGFDALHLVEFGNGNGTDGEIGIAEAPAELQASDTYTVGSRVGSGTSTIVGPSGTQIVSFENLEPVVDVVGAAMLIVNGTNADNAINYIEGTLPTNGFVSIDEHEPIEFSNKANLTINGLAGSDKINLNNSSIPTLLTSITVNGQNPTGSDTLIVNTIAGTSDEILFQPSAQGAGTVAHVALPNPPVAFSGIEHLTLVGQQAESDTFGVSGTTGSDAFTHQALTADSGTITGTMNRLALTEFALVPVSFVDMSAAVGREINRGAQLGGDDLLTVLGSAVDDTFALNEVAATSQIGLAQAMGLQGFGILLIDNMLRITVDGASGNDTFRYTTAAGGGATPTVQFLGGDSDSTSDSLTYVATPGVDTAINLENFTITAPGAQAVLYGGIEKVFADANGGSLTMNGTPIDDTFSYTPTAFLDGILQHSASPTQYFVSDVFNALTVTGGSGGIDSLSMLASSGLDLILVDAPARIARVNNAKAVTLGEDLETLFVLGLAGDDSFLVIASAGVPAGSTTNLRINIDGGEPNASDELVIAGAGGVPLAANQFVVVNQGRDPDTGVVRVYNGALPWPDITYRDVEIVSPRVTSVAPGLTPNLLELGPDRFEPNEFLGTASFLGSGPNIQVQNVSIYPSDTQGQATADNDFYRVVADKTGTLDFQVYFRTFPFGLIPGSGVLHVEVLDNLGNVIGRAGDGLVEVFGTHGAGGDARVRIPAVAGRTYYLRVFAPKNVPQPEQQPPISNIINGYDVTIINTPPAVPTSLELSRSVPPGVAGTPDTGDLPANAPNDDSGRSQFDDVTRINNPTIFVRLDDALLLQDLPGNQTPGGVPPMGPILIPFNVSTVVGSTTNGFRIALFDGGNGAPAAGNPHLLDPNDSTFIGFALPVPGVPHLYSLKIGTQGVDSLADGLHFITARTQIIDPSNPAQRGFGERSLALKLVVDTVAPPVFFGLPGNATDGLDPASDSGVIGVPGTFTDRITNDTTPTFFGTAEANSIIRLFAIAAGGNPVLIGMTVAVPEDGTNAFPNGRWVLTSNVDLNDPTLFPHDGLRQIRATAEDLAGNESNLAALDIFIDTQGPQITELFITRHEDFNLFGLKPENADQGPTPLVFGLTIRLQDLPAVAAGFLRDAIEAGVASTQGLYLLKGDHNGVIRIDQIVVTNDPPVVGQVPTASIELIFDEPLPDDRFTLTVFDTIPDIAGNNLDGENNAIQPTNFPLFPTGDGQPGGNFIARFTVDSRPEIGTYAAANVYIDANGNFVSDPTGKDNDFTNRDLTFSLGIVPSLFGFVSPMGLHDSVFAGKFVNQPRDDDDYDDEEGPGQAIAQAGWQLDVEVLYYDKLAAYGFDQTAGDFRWLIDTNHDGIIDPDDGDHATIQGAGFQINGQPVAGDFDGDPNNGDEIGLFTGTKWYFDTNRNWVIDGGDTVVASALRGLPIVGDFNGDGTVDLATWRDDQYYFNFGSGGPSWSGGVDASIDFGLPGNAERPIAADMNRDGITDLGLWLPARAGILPSNSGNWQFLISERAEEYEYGGGGFSNFASLNHPFTPTPLGRDIFAQFGDAFALPIVGNFDPPIAVNLPQARGLAPLLGTTTTVVGETVAASSTTTATTGDNWLSFSPLRSGTVKIETTSTSQTKPVALHLYKDDYRLMTSASGTGVGKMTLTASVVAGETYLIRVEGNTIADVRITNSVPDGDRLDVSRNGLVTGLDLLQIINELNAFGIHDTPLDAGNPKMYLDTNLDGRISPLDMLLVINHLATVVPAAPPAPTFLSVSPSSAVSSVTSDVGLSFALSLGGAAQPAAERLAPAALVPAAVDAVHAAAVYESSTAAAGRPSEADESVSGDDDDDGNSNTPTAGIPAL